MRTASASADVRGARHDVAAAVKGQLVVDGLGAGDRAKFRRGPGAGATGRRPARPTAEDGRIGREKRRTRQGTGGAEIRQAPTRANGEAGTPLTHWQRTGQMR